MTNDFPYRVAYKLNEAVAAELGVNCSDELDIDFATVEAAEKFIKTANENPGMVNLIDGMENARFWVTDERGNIYG